jgi:acetyl esterase/lipase
MDRPERCTGFLRRGWRTLLVGVLLFSGMGQVLLNLEPHAALALLQGPDPAKLDTVDWDVTYCVADGIELKMDVYYPTEAPGPVPAVIYVHGGGWSSGDKAAEGGPTEIPELIRRGFLAVSISYRLAPRWRFPAMIEDVKCAIRSLRANAAVYGIDPVRIGAWGGSAGGHLVALLGTLEEGVFESGDFPEESSCVQAVAVLSGPTDLPRLFARGGHETMRRVFGTTDPNAEILVQASPIHWVSSDDPPFLLVHGERDTLVPPEQARIFHERLTEAGVHATLVIVKNAEHGFRPVGGPIEPSRDEITR